VRHDSVAGAPKRNHHIEEIKWGTRAVPSFPNGASCLRLIRALAAETPEGWLEASRMLNMDLLKEHKKLKLSLAD
jgi:transposase-like protein